MVSALLHGLTEEATMAIDGLVEAHSFLSIDLSTVLF